MKKLALTTAAVVISATSAFAQSASIDGRFAVPGELTNIGNRGIAEFTVMTFSGQNTNGEDLKCFIYTNANGYWSTGVGGASCNWTAPRAEGPQ